MLAKNLAGLLITHAENHTYADGANNLELLLGQFSGEAEAAFAHHKLIQTSAPLLKINTRSITSKAGAQHQPHRTDPECDICSAERCNAH